MQCMPVDRLQGMPLISCSARAAAFRPVTRQSPRGQTGRAAAPIREQGSLLPGNWCRAASRGEPLRATATVAEKVPTETAVFLSEFSAQALFNFLSCTAWATSQTMAHSAVQQTMMFVGAHLFIFPMVVTIFANVSGAHFNPIITAAFVASGKLSPKSGVSYVTAQVLGGVLGAALALFTLPGRLQTGEMLGAHAVPAGRSIAQAFLGEAAGAFFFILVVFACIVDKRGWGKLAPFSLAACLPLLQWMLGPISSGCVNPARAFGVAFVTGAWSQHWLYWVAGILGGVVAGLLYTKVVLAEA